MDTYMKWMLSCGVIVAGLGLIYFLIERFKSDVAAKLSTPFAVLFSCMWLGGAVVGTFWGPFHLSTNLGYFAVWGAFCTSVYSMYLSLESARNIIDQAVAQANTGTNRQNGHILVLICSGVLLLASSIECGRAPCLPREAWAVSCAAISFFISLVVLLSARLGRGLSPQISKIIAFFLAIWWGFAVFTLTFAPDSIFFNTCNGFFAIIVGFLGSTYILMDEIGGGQETAQQMLPPPQTTPPENL